MTIKPEYRDELCVTLLTELLAYQFTSPVRWIETQNVILNDFKAERIIEVGPSPILANMAKRTISANESCEMAKASLLRKEVYCTSNHLDKIYYNGEPPMVMNKENEKQNVGQLVAVPETASPSPSSNLSTVDSRHRLNIDVKLNAEHLAKAIVSSKLRASRYSELNMTKSLKELCHGKSTLQNEIKSDLIKEFATFSEDNIEDTALLDICSDITVDGLGPVVLPQVMKFVGKNLTGRFSTLKYLRAYLTNEWSMVDPNPFLVYLTYSNDSISHNCTSETICKELIDKCCHSFAASENAFVIYNPVSTENSDDIELLKPSTISMEQFGSFKDQLCRLHTEQNNILSTHICEHSNRATTTTNEELQQMKDKMTCLENEFGKDLLNNSIDLMFSSKKVRVYSSSWNWVRQDVLNFCHLDLTETTRNSLTDIRKKMKDIQNRVDPISLKMLQYFVDNQCHDGPKKELLNVLIKDCVNIIKLNPVYSGELESFGFQIVENGNSKVIDEKVNLEVYIKTMSLGKGTNEVQKNTSVVSSKLDIDVSSYYKIETDLFQVYSKIIQYALASSNSNPSELWGQFKSLYEQILIFLKNSDQIASYFRAIVSDALSAINKPLYSKTENILVEDYSVDSSSDDESETSADEETVVSETAKSHSILPKKEKSIDSCAIPVGVIPFLHIKRHSHTNENWVYDKSNTQVFLNNLLNIGRNGISLRGKTILLLVSHFGNDFTREVIKALVQTGGTVLLATDDYKLETTRTLQKIYHQHGAKGSHLVVLPLNHASQVDVKRLCDYIYSKYGDIDYLLPLNAPKREKSVFDVSSEDELQMRATILNVLRLLGNIVRIKKSKKIETRPTFVLLPLSPTFGSKPCNGFLSESYSSLNKVLDMWHIEDWKNEISICGCVYGWTIETGEDMDISVTDLEHLGIRTFSPSEMAFNVLGLLTYDIVSLSQDSPIVADLNGGLHTLPSVMPVLNAMKAHTFEQNLIKKTLQAETHLDFSNKKKESIVNATVISPRGNISIDFPALLNYSELQGSFNGSSLEGLIDSSHMVVVTGFSEIGPWGNARTRWEMESSGTFSLEGCIEMAWIMGLIKYEKSNDYCGWVDSKNGAPVEGLHIKEKYEPTILKHAGIRIIEPELFCGYNPSKKQMLQEVVLNFDLQPVRTSAELGEQYKLEQGERVEIIPLEDDECLVHFLKGALLYVPKALDTQRTVAGQIPSGWDARSYGLPDEIVSQIDPITLFSLVSTAEALISSGVTDPYEMYKYVHVSEVGNCVGSGIGGMKSLQAVQLLRNKGENIQSDILPETFVNMTAAWINMLLISSSGPIKTPVGACATSVESLEIGYETIRAGKAKICIVGGVDDFHESVSHEFANMGATSNSTEEMASGREPQEMCRPATSTRNGFMESQGAGIQIIMRGDLAIQMGVPIYGVVGLTSTASDKISKSLPAPGKGILTCARELSNKPRFNISKLDIKYRKRQLEFRIKEINNWREQEILLGSYPGLVDELVQKQIVEAKSLWGSDFWKTDPNIAPIRGALSVFGLSVDDLNVVSCHGTSTKANEKNESQIIDKMMEHLGRTKGNPLPAVFQKHLTGHPKGAAGAWMLNGCLQMMNSSVIPGNRNADDIDSSFQHFEHLLFPSASLRVGAVKASMLTSFGFGQKGAMALVFNPNYLLASVSEDEYTLYAQKRAQRERIAQNFFVHGLVNNNIVQIKTSAPYSKEEEERVYLDPLIRFPVNH